MFDTMPTRFFREGDELSAALLAWHGWTGRRRQEDVTLSCRVSAYLMVVFEEVPGRVTWGRPAD